MGKKKQIKKLIKAYELNVRYLTGPIIFKPGPEHAEVKAEVYKKVIKDLQAILDK